MRRCAPPLPPPARAPGCPRCATLPGPQGLRGRPRPPTVPRRSGSQRPWHLPPPRGPAPIPQPPRQKPGSYPESLRQGLRESRLGPPELGGCLPHTPGSPARAPPASGLPPAKPSAWVPRTWPCPPKSWGHQNPWDPSCPAPVNPEERNPGSPDLMDSPRAQAREFTECFVNFQPFPFQRKHSCQGGIF